MLGNSDAMCYVLCCVMLHRVFYSDIVLSCFLIVYYRLLVWSLDKLSNKIYDMRDTYNQIEEGNLSKVRTFFISFLLLSTMS